MLERIYIVTLSLLVTHQIVAADWKEWEMFLVPEKGHQYLSIYT